MQIGRQPTNHRTWRGAGELAHGIGQAARAEQLAARPMGLGDAIAVEQQPVPGGERLPAGVARPTSPCPNAGPGAGGRRASRGATASPSRSGRSPSACPPTPSRPSPAAPPPPGAIIHSRFAFVRVVAAHAVTDDHRPPRREWLIIEWPEDHDGPTDYWLSNLPQDTEPERLARLARLRWTIELDYRQLKGELGLDHYKGRSYRGFQHHFALVTRAHAFLTLERMCPKAPRAAGHSRRRCCSCSPSCAVGTAAGAPAARPSISTSSSSSPDGSNKVLLGRSPESRRPIWGARRAGALPSLRPRPVLRRRRPL